MIRFAIVTVSFNAADCLEKTIKSVLRQSYPAVDYLIIDGGSNDGTQEIIGRYADRLTYWVSERDRGIYDGMNKGIAKVNELIEKDGTERYVLMLNADDSLIGTDVLAKLAAKIEQDKRNPDVVCCSWMMHPEHGTYLQSPGDLTQLPRRYVICHQATFVKGSVLASHPFDLKYRLAGDFDQLSQLYISGYRFAVYPDIVVSDMILNEGATERNWRASVREGFEVVKRNGQYRMGAESWLVFRKTIVRLIKRLLPRKVSDAFFGWLARHYKAM